MRSLGWLRVPLIATLIFLYVPIVVLVVMSFNASRLPFVWGGFSLKWYGALFQNAEILEGLTNTLIVALGATLFATILGTLIAIGIARYFRSSLLEAFSLAPAILPDIVLGIGLLVFYVLVGIGLGLHSVLLAHVVFGMAFVAAVVTARLSQTDPSLEEASRDLGASSIATFLRITVPSMSSSSHSSPTDRAHRPSRSSSTQWFASGSPRISMRWPLSSWWSASR